MPTRDRAVDAAGVEKALARLHAAGEDLRRRAPQQVLEALAAVLDRFREPGSPERLRLLRELPAATGFHRATIEEGLARALAGWGGEALHALWAREIGDRRAVGFPRTAVLLAGALPSPSLLAVLAPLALRSPVLVRASSHDPVTPRVLMDALRAAGPTLARCLEIVDFPHADDAALTAFLSAECVVATGSDATVRAVAARVRSPQRLVAYGHRVSVAVLGPEALSGEALAQAARALALDVALWDQLGCLSPVALYVLGASEVPKALLDALANAFADAEERWPRGALAPETAAVWAGERSTAELRAAGGEVRLRGPEGAGWALVAERDAAWRGSPLHRFLRIHPTPDADALLAALRPLAPHLASVGVAGLGEAGPRLAARLADLGASRICPVGTMQAPPLDWPHDGQPVLVPLARLATL